MFSSLLGALYLQDLVVTLLIAAAQTLGAFLILRGPARNASPRARKQIKLVTTLSVVALTFAHLFLYEGLASHFPRFWTTWGRGMILLWGVLSILWLAAYGLTVLLSSGVPVSSHGPARRNFLRVAQVALFGAPVAATGYGMFIQRFRLSLREQRIILPTLPETLNGLRVVQLTDIHLSPFLSEGELAQAVALANETRAHLALVTGDLISGPGDPLDACIAQLAGLKSDLGIYGCLGNHERYAEAEDYAQAKGAQFGLHFLRHQAVKLNFGGATLNLAGVDYQRFNRPYLNGVETLMDPAAFNVLLSHNPDVFPVAVRKGFPLTISGHTHGGQVRMEILEQDLNVARFFTPYVDGLYRLGDSSIFVSRGIGTIGLPARLGAPPEVALITLCRT
jgi:predicted MPP superfamily phosphohydrolase